MKKFTFQHLARHRLIAGLLLATLITPLAGCATADPHLVVGVAAGAILGAMLENAHAKHQQARREAQPQTQTVRASPASAYANGAISQSVLSRDVVPPPTSLPPGPALYEDGLAAYKAGNYPEALAKLELYSRIDLIPTEQKVQALTYGAAAAFLLDQTNRSTRLVQKLLGIRPNPLIDDDIFPPEFRLFVRQIRSAPGQSN